MTECPKCGGKNINGPGYVSGHSRFPFGEALKYMCERCHYEDYYPTAAKQNDPYWLYVMAKRS